MCDDLNTIKNSILSYGARFDPSLLSCAQAHVVMLTCAGIEASVASMKALAAARAAEGGSWQKDGYRSAADELSQKTKTSPASAKKTLTTGARLRCQPKLAKAALSGQLSPEQTAIVAEGVETAEQLAFLRAERCDRVQGFFFSQAVPLSSLESYIIAGAETVAAG